MIITLVTLTIFLASLGLCKASDDDLFPGLTAILAGAALLFMAIFIAVAPLQVRSDIVKREAIASTLDAARAQSNPIELAAITRDIVEFNTDLAQAKYWQKNPLTSWFFSPKYQDIKPIK